MQGLLDRVQYSACLYCCSAVPDRIATVQSNLFSTMSSCATKLYHVCRAVATQTQTSGL